jgi:broad specificity phosphatase PhoE
MELYILRHGTTTWNRAHRLQGQRDIPLDEEGVLLAREVGDALSDVSFDRCYSSPLIRAYETAELVLSRPEPAIITDDRIKEISFGDYEGRAIKAGHPELKKIEAFNLDDYPTPPNGESLPSLLSRTGDFLQDLLAAKELENSRILISTHGACGRAIMHHIWGGDDFWHGMVPPNCSICIVRYEQGRAVEIRQDVIFYSSRVRDYYKVDGKKKDN